VARILITGGAGFIGSNLADRLLRQGHEVTIFDNLSRFASEFRLAWLRTAHGPGGFRLVNASLTDFDLLLRAVNGAERIYHLAGQVAVTASVQNPRQDFQDNILGTFNVLEAARLAAGGAVFIHASTNKVYGSMKQISVVEEPTRYGYADLPFGVSENQPLDFHSPYGCSKGAGDQYARDYSRIFGMRTVVMRQSCIYGCRQFGMEDQGWLAWFVIAALNGYPITIYGNGKQVRDVLFVDDLLDIYEAAIQHIDIAAGQIYNVGGGPKQTLSVWTEFGPMLEELLDRKIPVTYAEPRPADQRIYISDIRKAERELDWRPCLSVSEGVRRFLKWAQDHQELFKNGFLRNLPGR